MKMHNPPHPGELLREGVLKPMNMKVADLARRLGMSRVSLSRVVNGHAAISSDLAVRLERAGLSTARVWMGLQADYDLWQAENREQPHNRTHRSRLIVQSNKNDRLAPFVITKVKL